MPIHLLIVDDEQITRDGLREMIPWGRYGIDRISATSNGRRALEIAQSDPPDILLTDVRMPKMDGIELARHVRALAPDCRILFISAYSDKDYLKSAIDLKAEQYIEKPVNIEQVERIVGALARSIRSRRMQRESEDALLHGLLATEPLVEQTIALALIDPQADLEELYRTYGKLYFTWQEKDWYTPVCLRPMCPGPENRRVLLDRVERYLKQYQALPVVSFYAGLQGNGSVVLLFHRPRRQQLEKTLLPELCRALRDTQDLPFAVGLGPECTDLHQLPESWRRAAAAADGGFYGDSEGTFPREPSGGPLPAEEADRLLKSVIQDEDRAAAAQRLCDQLAACRYADVYQVRELLYRVYWQFLQYAGTEEAPVDRERFFCLTLGQIRALFRQGSAGMRILQELHTDDPRVLRTVHCVLRQFSRRECSIRSIAEEVGLSQNYLCTLFRQQTGRTLNDFILHVRVETAKELLTDTQMKLYEISNRVGIADPNYLSFVFKRDTGVTPSAWRSDRRGRRGSR